MNAQLAIKVDVDTLRGYREGVPRLLELFDTFNIKASIFFSLGPDNSGKAIRRIFRPGFLQKMFRTNPAGTYGLKTMLYGTLLPAPHIIRSNPAIMRHASQCGHDCAIHAYDHVKWQDTLDSMTRGTVKLEFDRAFELFTNYCGKQATSCAAPAWKVNCDSLTVQDEYHFLYCSDSRGYSPFIPKIGSQIFKTMQIPSTWPTMDEIYGMQGINDQTINDYYLRLLKPGLNVHTIHAEMEGMGKLGVVQNLFEQCKKKGVTFVTLKQVAQTVNIQNLPVCEIEQKLIPGRAGKVAVQAGDGNSNCG